MLLKMKIRRLVLISNMYPSPQNVRFGIFVKRFEEAIKNDFEVKKVVLTKKEGAFSKLLGYGVLYLQIFRLWFSAKSTDIVYVHFPLYVAPVLIPLVWRRIPLVLNFHGNDIQFNTPLKRMLAFWLKWIVPKCKLVVPSAYYRERVIDIFGITGANFLVYPSGGVDSAVFRPIESYHDEFVYGFVSNFIPKKGWEVYLEALRIIQTKEEVFSFKGIMVGDGPDLKKIESYIRANQLNVEVLKSVEQHVLTSIYAMFDVFVFPSYREEESLGLVGIEAMMCGIPVIASKVGGPMGYVEPGLNGFLVNRNDSADLAEKMIQYKNLSKEKIQEMKNNSVQTAKAFDSTKVGKGLLRWLKEIQ